MDETFTWFSLSVAHACMGETNSSRMQEGWASEGPEDIGCSTMMMNILIIVLTIASYLLSLSLFVIIIRYCYRYRYRYRFRYRYSLSLSLSLSLWIAGDCCRNSLRRTVLLTILR